MKYNDRKTLLLKKNSSRDTDEFGYVFIRSRETKRRNKKTFSEFWGKNLKGFLTESFWESLDDYEKKRVIREFKIFEGDKKDFAKKIKKDFHEKLEISREISLSKIGI